MKIVDKIPYVLISGFIYLLIYSSCANQGMPTGGPRDSVPPMLLKTEPLFGGLNYKEKVIKLTFDEYIKFDKVMEMMVISPPLLKRPSVKMKSKTLLIQFNEELRDSVTYSIDFKNSIEDNNEGNPYESLRFSFSTWDVLDSLRVAGVVKNASNLEPVDKALVLLHKNLHDSAIFSVIPDYIAKTNEEGLFMIDNIAPGTYHIFSIFDTNSDMMYNEGAEEIAFSDTLIIPEAHFFEELDTMVSGADSLLISGHTHFLPEPIYLLQFTEDIFSQFLTSVKRETKYRCQFIFEESVKDTFEVNLLNNDSEDWYKLEPNTGVDTITLWITDTIVANLDSINIEVLYNQIDTAENIFVQKDTMDLIFANEKKEQPKRKRKSDKKEQVVTIPQFTFASNLKGSGFDLNVPIAVSPPEPIKYFHPDQVHLYLEADTTATPLEFLFEKDTTMWRRYLINYNWEANTEYRFEIDSAASENIYGVTSQRFIKKFKTQKDDFYGTIIATLENVDGSVLVQLLKNDKEETLVKSKRIKKNGIVTFDYLAPAKYIMRAIYDDNDNGKWDKGSFQDRVQSEKISYLQKVLKVRSNWDINESWDLTIDHTYPKEMYDKELEAEKKKKAEEERKKKAQPANRKSSNSGFGNSMQNSGSSRPIKR